MAQRFSKSLRPRRNKSLFRRRPSLSTLACPSKVILLYIKRTSRARGRELTQPAGHCRVRVCPRRSTRMVPGSHGGRSSGAPCRMRHPSPAARAIRNNPAPTTTAPMARAMCSPAGARRSTVMAAVTTAIARRSMTPMMRRIAVRPAQQ
jgi:hypothetical protein